MRRWKVTLSIRGEGEGGSECWAIHGWWKHSDTVGRCLRIVDMMLIFSLPLHPNFRCYNLCSPAGALLGHMTHLSVVLKI